MKPISLKKYLKPLLSTATKAVKEHSAGATLAVSGVGYIMAVVSGCRATVKAVRKTDYETEKKGEPLTKKELVQANWKYYIQPAALVVGSTIGLGVASRNYGTQIEKLAALCAIREMSLQDQEAAVKDILGEKKALEIHDETSRKMLARTYSEDMNVMHTGKGNTLCLDKFSGRYFRMSIENYRKAVNDANFLLNRREVLSYNDLYYEVCDQFEPVGYGDEVGWHRDWGPIEPIFTSALTRDNEPCLVIDFATRPRLNYDR